MRLCKAGKSTSLSWDTLYCSIPLLILFHNCLPNPSYFCFPFCATYPVIPFTSNKTTVYIFLPFVENLLVFEGLVLYWGQWCPVEDHTACANERIISDKVPFITSDMFTSMRRNMWDKENLGNEWHLSSWEEKKYSPGWHGWVENTR